MYAWKGLEARGRVGWGTWNGGSVRAGDMVRGLDRVSV